MVEFSRTIPAKGKQRLWMGVHKHCITCPQCRTKALTLRYSYDTQLVYHDFGRGASMNVAFLQHSYLETAFFPLAVLNRCPLSTKRVAA